MIQKEIHSLLASFAPLSEVVRDEAVPDDSLTQTDCREGELLPLVNLLNLLGLEAGLSEEGMRPSNINNYLVLTLT